MNLGHIIGVIFIFSLFFVMTEVSSESLDYDVLKVDLGEDVIISNSDIWLNGDILVDGNLSIENSHIKIFKIKKERLEQLSAQFFQF